MSHKVITPLQRHDAIDALWRKGLPPGDKTGWPSLDVHYSVPSGYVTVITGWPSAGKSEFLDALLVHLTHQGWYTAIFSAENRPVEVHLSKMLEKFTGMPFGEGPSQRMTLTDIGDTLVEIMAPRFLWIEPPDEESSLSANGVVEAATPWLLSRKGEKRALVIDPWNELEHWRPRELSETEYISKTLSFLRNWARKNMVHVFIVAHPQKMRRDQAGKLPVPTLDMISGSQHWWNKADFGITVYRDPAKYADGPNAPGADEVEIYVQKVRFKHHGRPGLVVLRYDRVCGRYREIASMRDVKAYRDRAGE